MAYTQVCRFLDNEDSSTIGYKTFNEYTDDRYPTFSICLYSPPGYSLQYSFRYDIKEKIGTSALDYNQLLKGVSIENGTSTGEELLVNISKTGYDQFKLTLEDFMYAYSLDKQKKNVN